MNQEVSRLNSLGGNDPDACYQPAALLALLVISHQRIEDSALELTCDSVGLWAELGETLCFKSSNGTPVDE